jgi:REP element-mobilizing transposase RayT
MGHTYTNLLTHVIFSTKGREPFMADDVKPRILAYIGGVVRKIGGTALCVNGPQDHIHGLIALPATIAIAETMRLIKTNSSKWVHETFSHLEQFAWQTGYGAFSVSESNVPTVRAYIENQEEHHKTMTFQEEFVAFLKRHNVPYDPRYIWE